MYLGRFVETGPTDTIMSVPHHPYTKALISSTPALTADERAGRAIVEVTGEPPKAINLPRGCRFAPRCPFVFDKCLTDDPALMPVSTNADHSSACWLPRK
jgi:peptide/nickel transport system ATP-binding protein